MNKLRAIILSWLFLPAFLNGQVAQKAEKLLSDDDLIFLRDLTKDVLESSRIYPGQVIVKNSGGNGTGGTLIRPGGRSSYPSFWIRDYAMSLECGFVKKDEQEHMLRLTASRQCDQTWIAPAGSIIPEGAIADHIRIDDSKPIFYPGTTDYRKQGEKRFGMAPPYCDQFYFIHMAYYYIKNYGSPEFLLEEINGKRLFDRMELAFGVPPTEQDGVLVYTTDDFRGVDFGFRDVIQITGKLCFPSILKYKASIQMAELCEMINRKDKAELYRNIASRLKHEIPETFYDNRGMLVASTGKSSQPDVWSTALAVYYGIPGGDSLRKSCTTLRDAYKEGTLSKNGNIRHVLTSDDFNASTSWEISIAKKNYYQNGAYWGTPVGWVCYAISRVDKDAARKLAKEYIDDLRKGDYRKGPDFGAPWECYNETGQQNSVYLATVSCPYIVFK